MLYMYSLFFNIMRYALKTCWSNTMFIKDMCFVEIDWNMELVWMDAITSQWY